jgi:putative ABC transport system permease protein
MKFDLLVSLNFLSPDEEGADRLRAFLETWGTIAMVTYTRLEPGASELAVEDRLTALLAERSVMKTFSATLQPLTDAHLGSRDILFDDFNRDKGDAQKVLILASVAVFLLLIAAFNFMNLSTARASLRAKEVGLRKTVGATRGQLVAQFLQESLTLVAFAAALGLALTWVLEPLVSLPLDQGFIAYLFSHEDALLAAALAMAALGLLAGSYPAFVLSSFKPVLVLKGKFANSAQGLWLRRLLVVLQFALSVAVIIGMLVVQQQLDYMRSKDPGFVRDGVLNLELNDPALQANYAVLKNRLLQLPQVETVASSSNMPGQTFGRRGVTPEGGGENDFFIMSALQIDSAYLDTLGMKLAAGRGYSTDYANDASESLLLNESAVRALGWRNDDAVGRSLGVGNNQRRTVIGVVQDFHFADLRHQIEPVMLTYREEGNRMLSLRMNSGAPEQALAGIAAVWSEINPAFPFSYSFFSQEYESQFSDEEEFSSLLNQFTFIAIIIACLGLYGLASFSAEQKTKEIGVRKVLGAGNGSLLRLILREYAVLMVLANLLAWGLAWVVMQRWLSGFAYRAELPLTSFALATVGTTVVALLTVGRVLVKVLQTRLAETLRYE